MKFDIQRPNELTARRTIEMLTTSVQGFLTNVVGLPQASSWAAITSQQFAVGTIVRSEPRQALAVAPKQAQRPVSKKNSAQFMRIDFDGNPTFVTHNLRVKYDQTSKYEDVAIL